MISVTKGCSENPKYPNHDSEGYVLSITMGRFMLDIWVTRVKR